MSLFGWSQPSGSTHDALHCALTDFDAKLEQFATDSLGAPADVLESDAPDQSSGAWYQPGRSRSRLATPVDFEQSAMPTKGGGGLHDQQRFAPVGQDTSEGKNRQPISPLDPWTSNLTPQDAELLAKQRVLEDQRGLAPA